MFPVKKAWENSGEASSYVGHTFLYFSISPMAWFCSLLDGFLYKGFLYKEPHIVLFAILCFYVIAHNRVHLHHTF